MRKVILGINTTLDGFIQGPKGEMDWFPVDEESWRDLHDQFSSMDTF